MTVPEFMASLALMGGWLTLDGDRIRLCGVPKLILAGVVRDYINAHREEVLRYLAEPRTGLTSEEIDVYARVLPPDVIDGLRAPGGDPQDLLDFIVREWEAALDGDRVRGEDDPW